jgi:hypothetical protein
MFGRVDYYKPVVVRKIRSFRAPDPWRRGVVSEWTLNEYGLAAVGHMMGMRLDGTKPGKLARSLGIESGLDGRYHMLPRSLAGLSLKRQAADELLPALLREMEPGLERMDFPHPMDVIFWSPGIGLSALAVGLVAFTIWGYASHEIGKSAVKVLILLVVLFGYSGVAALQRALLPGLRKRRQQNQILLKLHPVAQGQGSAA